MSNRRSRCLFSKIDNILAYTTPVVGTVCILLHSIIHSVIYLHQHASDLRIRRIQPRQKACLVLLGKAGKPYHLSSGSKALHCPSEYIPDLALAYGNLAVRGCGPLLLLQHIQRQILQFHLGHGIQIQKLAAEVRCFRVLDTY